MSKPRLTKAEKEAERRADSIGQKACYGFQIPIMELGKVSAKAKEAVAAGTDDATALATVREYVATFAKAA